MVGVGFFLLYCTGTTGYYRSAKDADSVEFVLQDHSQFESKVKWRKRKHFLNLQI